MKRLAIISTHPIQYNAPSFRLLALDGRVQLKVFYTWEQSRSGGKFDPGFGKNIEWDIPLLDGYDYTFIRNTAADPGPHHFYGMVNPTLNQEVADWKPDAVLVYGWNFSSHLACLRHFHGRVPVLFRGDSTLLDERPGIKKWVRRNFLTWVYGHIDYALYVGANNKDYFLRHGLRENQLIFVPHAVDNDRFAATDQQYSERAKALKQELGILEDDLVILYAGKLEPKKNPFFLLELAKLLDNKKLKFLIVGNGVLEEQLKKAAAADPRILFLGFQNQQVMPVVYRIGSVFILPSAGPGETWGLAVNEAMACGKPVMVSAMAGCAIDLVPVNENGLVMNIRDISASVQFISEFLQDSSRLSVMGERSRYIIRGYSFEKIVDTINVLLNQIINL